MGIIPQRLPTLVRLHDQQMVVGSTFFGRHLSHVQCESCGFPADECQCTNARKCRKKTTERWLNEPRPLISGMDEKNGKVTTSKKSIQPVTTRRCKRPSFTSGRTLYLVQSYTEVQVNNTRPSTPHAKQLHAPTCTHQPLRNVLSTFITLHPFPGLTTTDANVMCNAKGDG